MDAVHATRQWSTLQKSGDRFRGMIWMDKPQDPGLFDAHAIRVDALRHTLSVKFDVLPANTFSLLEPVMKKSRAAPSAVPAPV